MLISGIRSGSWLGPVGRVIKALVLSPFVRQKMASFAVKPNTEDLRPEALIEAGEVTPVIDRTYPLSEVPEALALPGRGHARGKVVITV